MPPRTYWATGSQSKEKWGGEEDLLVLLEMSSFHHQLLLQVGQGRFLVPTWSSWVYKVSFFTCAESMSQLTELTGQDVPREDGQAQACCTREQACGGRLLHNPIRARQGGRVERALAAPQVLMPGQGNHSLKLLGF